MDLIQKGAERWNITFTALLEACPATAFLG
jgi:hypothetical protein